MGDNRELISATLTADFVLNSTNRACYREFLQVSTEEQIFGSKKINDVISRINSALNVGKSRLEGLCLLEQLLQQCTTEVFTAHAMVWAKLLLQSLQMQKSPSVVEKSCHVLGILLSKAEGFPEIFREMANSVLPPLVTTLIQDTSQQCTCAALRCLVQCMTRFSGPCGNFRGKIENLVVPLMDQSDSPVVELACECYSWLSRCGGGGNQGIKYTEGWTLYSDKLLASMTGILDALFKDLEISSYQVPGEPLSLPEPAMTQPLYTYTLARRYCMLANTLAKMLSNDFPAVVKLPATDIIQMINRAVMKTPTFLMKVQTRDRIHLASVIPLIHKASFVLLSAVIVSCGSNLIPFADTLNKIFTQTLAWSSTAENSYGSTRPHRGLRRQVYSTILVWLQSVGATVNVDQLSKTLIEHGLKEAKPETDVVKLQSKSSMNMESAELVYRHSTKKRRKHGGGDVGQFTTHRKVDQLANRETCQAALEALRWLVLTCGPLLSQNHHKALQLFAVPILLEISHSMSDYPIPYRDGGCRKALYNLLVALTLNPSPKWPPPTQCTITLLTMGQSDVDLQVAGFCRESLVTCHALTHPRTPSYTTPLPPPDLSGHPPGEESHDQKRRIPRSQAHFPDSWFKGPFANKLGTSTDQTEAPTPGQPGVLTPGQSGVLTPGQSGVNGDKASSSQESSEDEGSTTSLRVSTFKDNNSPLRAQQQGKGQSKVKGHQKDKRRGSDSEVAMATSFRTEGSDPPPAVVQGLQEGLAGMEIGDSNVEVTTEVRVMKTAKVTEVTEVKDTVAEEGVVGRKRKLSDGPVEDGEEPGTSQSSKLPKVTGSNDNTDSTEPAVTGEGQGQSSLVTDDDRPQTSGLTESQGDGDMPSLDVMLASFVDAPPDSD